MLSTVKNVATGGTKFCASNSPSFVTDAPAFITGVTLLESSFGRCSPVED
ncbi:MAG: hypothetical protein P0116_08210 [Candidatus Nitrosocosmicus sp.]|nr:hypothetical protein [Candidatus Nitrosocosmicus sp.]